MATVEKEVPNYTRTSNAAVVRTAAAPIIRPVMPELDSVRGVAVLAVLLYHGLFHSIPLQCTSGITRVLVLASKPGWLGVELFFVLSGFLITNLLLESKGRPTYYRRFYVRRALRILPAYLAVIVGLFCVGYIDLPFLVLSSLFLANFTQLFDVALQYGPFWSLAVEEHYYLVWPTVVNNLSGRALAVVAACVCLFSPVLRLVAFQYGMREELFVYTWFTCDGLAMGSLLALFLRNPAFGRRSVLVASVSLIAVALAMLAVGGPYGIMYRQTPLGSSLQYTTCCLLFTGAIAGILLLGTSRLRRFVQLRSLEFVGSISFGLYLVHMIFFYLFDYVVEQYDPDWKKGALSLGYVFMRFAVAGGAAVLLATISRRYFEEYFLRMKSKLAP